MKQDKAIIKTLEHMTDQLSYGFDIRVMNRIMIAAEAKSKKDYFLSLVLAGAVSLIICTGAYFALYHYFSFSILGIFSYVFDYFKLSPLLIYSSYFAFLMLVLLVLDYKFRQMMKKAGKC
jgi:hypothetical protein